MLNRSFSRRRPQGGGPKVGMILGLLDGYGGLERYAVAFATVLAESMPVDIVSTHVVDREAVERSFGMDLGGVRLVHDPRCGPTVRPGPAWQGPLRYREASRDYLNVTGSYDVLIGHTIGLPWQSAGRRSILICHFPVVRNDRVEPGKRLDPWWRSSGRLQREVRRRVGSWHRIVTSSRYASEYLERYWAHEADVINPPVAQPPPPRLEEKRPWIVAAGFFAPPDSSTGEQWSYKRHEVLIEAFKRMCDDGLRSWELHLAGHVSPHARDHAFVAALRGSAEGYPVVFHPSCPRAELEELYRHGSLFWHAAGYGANQEEHPERMEHFGMVTAEAMGWGCVPIVIARGGQTEIVEHDRSGLLWETLEQLREHTFRLATNADDRRSLAGAAVQRAQHFSMDRFRREVHALVAQEIAALSGSGGS